MDTVSQQIPLAQLAPNEGQIQGLPENPRIIKENEFNKLKKSIKDDYDLLNVKELIVLPHNGSFVCLGGNMRLRAIQSLHDENKEKYGTVPCKVVPKDTPLKKLKKIVIIDNAHFGEDNFELLANEWEREELEEWGVDVPNWDDPKEEKEEDQEEEKELCPTCGKKK